MKETFCHTDLALRYFDLVICSIQLVVRDSGLWTLKTSETFVVHGRRKRRTTGHYNSSYKLPQHGPPTFNDIQGLNGHGSQTQPEKTAHCDWVSLINHHHAAQRHGSVTDRHPRPYIIALSPSVAHCRSSNDLLLPAKTLKGTKTRTSHCYWRQRQQRRLRKSKYRNEDLTVRIDTYRATYTRRNRRLTICVLNILHA